MKLDDSPHANRIRAAAVSWGLLDVLTDDDPRMTLDTAKQFDDPNPQPPARVSHLILLRRGELWSFCVNLQTAHWALAWGPRMLHCQPYPSRACPP